jgi:type II secretory ATPase GspE/PulE/Tfp pilus assembly ATPase PilB-like protein
MSQDARVDQERSTERRARILGLTYYDTSQPGQKNLYKDLLPKEELYKLRVIPLQVSQSAITFGITNTTSQQTLKNLTNNFLDQKVSFVLISDIGYNEYMRLYDPPKQVVYQDISLTTADKRQLIQSVSTTLDQIRADDMLAYLTQQAHKLAASDIHVENQADSVRIRLRIDGVLHPIAEISHEKSRMLISAIASAGNISTSADQAQQGHIAQRITMADGTLVDVNLRVETVPAINGMDIVMRLFNMQADMYTLDRLGLTQEERDVVEAIIHKPTGLVLAVGPTGSGKTTTLYSMLNSLNNDERKIVTLEDPVEYQFNGITQVSVATKATDQTEFAERLRAVLRLDPDVVMVGEIRDMDTAKTALQASLTGHLVLSTFHAGSAAAALTRLMDVIGENPLFLSGIRLIMAQRLVRRLDDASKEAYIPEAAILKRLQSIADSMPPTVERPNMNGLKLYRPQPTADNPFGYKGQLALREQMVMTDMLRSALQEKGTNVSTQALEAMAVEAGMLTMQHNALLKLLAGETTVEEVFRVLG